MKNDSDKENYNREFQDLQMQIYDLAQVQFNGVSLFAVRVSDAGGRYGHYWRSWIRQYAECLCQCQWIERTDSKY